MAKKLDYEKDTKRRRVIRENIKSLKEPINEKTTGALRVSGARLKKERKTDAERLKEIKERQKAEEKAKKEKAKNSKKVRSTTKADDDFVDSLFGKGTAKKLRKQYAEEASGRGSRAGGGKSATGLGIKAPAGPSPRKKLKMLNMGGAIKSNKGAQDFRKGGMVLSTVDNRINK